MESGKITIDGNEYTLVNIKSIKINNDENDALYKNEDILLIPEILNKEIINLSIQIG